ncbi:MAG: AI-2E family transporter [Rhodobacteraceae bacterium]|nr:AI-2E family transporter [Paracoccaceae bacterium]
MALPNRTQTLYWSVAALIFALALWYLGSVITPFLIGMAIAYFLDPVADKLEVMGCSRVLATVIITVVAVMVFVMLVVLVVPTLVHQAISLFNAAPTIFTTLRDFLTERYPSLMDETSIARQSLVSLGETIQDRGGELVNTLLTSAAGVVNIVLLFVIVPVVAFYLLLDWDNLVAEVDKLIPRDHLETIRTIARDIDAVIAGFVRGMGTVCLILGTYYAAALMIVGLQFGLVVGFIAGLVTFIPYLGAVIGGVLAIGLALFQYWGALDGGATDWIRIGIVAAIFGLGQVIEGNILTPKLVGNSVGLHPVWLLFSLSVFGALFGFVGLLIGVPVAAAIGVVARFLVGEYKAGLLYRGRGTSDGDDA